LHTAFNGQPEKINVAIGLMYELKMIAVSLMQTPTGDGSKTTAGRQQGCPAGGHCRQTEHERKCSWFCTQNGAPEERAARNFLKPAHSMT
jgi:hypothetical protein